MPKLQWNFLKIQDTPVIVKHIKSARKDLCATFFSSDEPIVQIPVQIGSML